MLSHFVMGRTIGLIAIKGGVGKTTLSASLASDLANHHKCKVLLIDANFSAPNLGLHMNIVSPKKTIHHVLDGKAHLKQAIHNSFGVDVIPGSYNYRKSLNYLRLRDKIKKAKDNYDFVIIDSSPSLNDEVLSTMLAADSLFVVTTPDYPTLSCSLKAAELAKQRGKPISGIIINKIRDPKYELTLKEIEQATDIPVIARIPDDKTNVRALFTRIPTSIYNKRSKFGKEVSKIGAALAYKEEKPNIFRRMFSRLKREEINRAALKESFYRSRFSYMYE